MRGGGGGDRFGGMNTILTFLLMAAIFYGVIWLTKDD